MKKTVVVILLALISAFAGIALTACGGAEESMGGGDPAGTPAGEAGLTEGTYVVNFTTDHAMFHVNEANGGKGILTVEPDGQMTVHVSLVSKKIVNLYPGTAQEAQGEGALLLEPTVDVVTYEDGYTEEVYGFDIPVPAIDQEFDCALIGTKGKWYDHKVKVTDPVPGEDLHAGTKMDLEDGEYQVEIAKGGGTGKASIESPAKLVVAEGKAILTVTWSSPHYDYMIVEGERYEPINEEGNSVFEIPVTKLNEAFPVIGDTTAMSQPHQIEYQLTVTLAE